MDFGPTRDGTFLSLAEMMVRGKLRLLDASGLPPRSRRSSSAFVSRFGQPPDFVDGHQHAHLFPQVREALLDVVKEKAPHGLGAPVRPAWRRCRQRSGITRRASSMR